MHKLYIQFHSDAKECTKTGHVGLTPLQIFPAFLIPCFFARRFWMAENHPGDYLRYLIRVHQQAASGVQGCNNCSPVTSTWKSWTEQSKFYYLLNLYEGCWIFSTDASSDSSEENVSQVPLKGQANRVKAPQEFNLFSLWPTFTLFLHRSPLPLRVVEILYVSSVVIKLSNMDVLMI